MVSIIIPCYNVADSLGVTLDSVLNQTDSDWEVIAVDDGSLDKTREIIERYASEDSRIKLYTKENGGVSSARNLGLAKAKGEWIYFLDGDDQISRELVATINSLPHDYKVAIFEFIKVDLNSDHHYHIKPSNDILSDFLINKQTIHISSCAVKRDLIEANRIKLDENTFYGEDREYIVTVLVLNPKIYFIQRELFFYNYREGSAMSQKQYSYKKFTSILSCERVYNLLKATKHSKGALTVLKFTIARHLKLFYESPIQEPKLLNSLLNYTDKYLGNISSIDFSKIGIYTFIVSLFAKNKKALRFFLKLY